MRKKLSTILETKISTEEKKILLNMQPEDIKIKVTDTEDPRENGIYQYDKHKEKFLERTGKSNYPPELEVDEFMEALENFDYEIEVLNARD